MATKKKLLQAAAGNAGGGAGLDVEEVFSTFLYSGNGSTRTITNGIDLDGEGGLVWIKNRGNTTTHNLHDTERGAGTYLQTNASSAEVTDNDEVTAFNSNGFSLGDGTKSNSLDGSDYASWTFRKAPKFFDVVTYTGDGVAGREISHNLGCAVGAMFIKRTDDSKYWPVYHRSTTATHFLRLNSTAAAQDSTIPFGDVEPTSTVFTVSGDEVVNTSGGTYVAYLFAHNDGDGEFGPDGDADVIKCGSFTTDGTGDVAEINLGFEPQWIMLKKTSGTGDWRIGDVIRGDTVDNTFKVLEANTSDAEGTLVISRPTATGYKIDTGFGTNATGIYIAIRRGTAVPESATDVFAISDRKNEIPSFPSGFPVDFLIGPRTINGTDNNEVKTRLISGGYLRTNTTGAETSSDQSANFAHNDGFFNFSGANANQYSWMWRRAPKYMECVAYFGNSTAGRTVQHGLTVTPEMMWVKRRNSSTDWRVYHKDIGNTHNLQLNSTAAKEDALYWNDTTPTDSVFTLNNFGDVNGSSNTYIAYLFATLAGISKVGSVTHSGTTNVDCGFTSGARFVLLKRTDATGDWYVWDSVRGIVAGNDPYLLLNSTGAEVTNTDYIDPLSSGFTITSSFTAGDYIFYAIA